MSKRPWMKFYPCDWRGEPRLRMCSLQARGLWIELISYMHEGEPYGHLTVGGKIPDLTEIACLVSRPENEVRRAFTELEIQNVFSRSENGAIYSRRMVRDEQKLERQQKGGSNGGGNPQLRRGIVPKDQRVRPFKRSDAPNKTRRIYEKSGGKCHWCGSDLVCDAEPGVPLPSNFFHIDHVVAVCDG